MDAMKESDRTRTMKGSLEEGIRVNVGTEFGHIHSESR